MLLSTVISRPEVREGTLVLSGESEGGPRHLLNDLAQERDNSEAPLPTEITALGEVRFTRCGALPADLLTGSFLQHVHKLKRLTLCNCELTDLEPLCRVTRNVEYVDVSWNAISSFPTRISALWTFVVELRATHNRITDYSEVRKLITLLRLKKLHLADNPVAYQSDYRGWIITQMPQLFDLDGQLIDVETRRRAALHQPSSARSRQAPLPRTVPESGPGVMGRISPRASVVKSPGVTSPSRTAEGSSGANNEEFLRSLPPRTQIDRHYDELLSKIKASNSVPLTDRGTNLSPVTTYQPDAPMNKPATSSSSHLFNSPSVIQPNTSDFLGPPPGALEGMSKARSSLEDLFATQNSVLEQANRVLAKTSAGQEPPSHTTVSNRIQDAMNAGGPRSGSPPRLGQPQATQPPRDAMLARDQHSRSLLGRRPANDSLRQLQESRKDAGRTVLSPKIGRRNLLDHSPPTNTDHARRSGDSEINRSQLPSKEIFPQSELDKYAHRFVDLEKKEEPAPMTRVPQGSGSPRIRNEQVSAASVAAKNLVYYHESSLERPVVEPRTEFDDVMAAGEVEEMLEKPYCEDELLYQGCADPAAEAKSKRRRIFRSLPPTTRVPRRPPPTVPSSGSFSPTTSSGPPGLSSFWQQQEQKRARDDARKQEQEKLASIETRNQQYHEWLSSSFQPKSRLGLDPEGGPPVRSQLTASAAADDFNLFSAHYPVGSYSTSASGGMAYPNSRGVSHGTTTYSSSHEQHQHNLELKSWLDKSMEHRKFYEDEAKLEALRVLQQRIPINPRHLPIGVEDTDLLAERENLTTKSHIADILMKVVEKCERQHRLICHMYKHLAIPRDWMIQTALTTSAAKKAQTPQGGAVRRPVQTPNKVQKGYTPKMVVTQPGLTGGMVRNGTGRPVVAPGQGVLLGDISQSNLSGVEQLPRSRSASAGAPPNRGSSRSPEKGFGKNRGQSATPRFDPWSLYASFENRENAAAAAATVDLRKFKYPKRQFGVAARQPNSAATAGR
ncbi:unnamed protein product [Amoebophrya sp. A120]|nr:unnamed protein product [Amoebophrya sp. A120]|eukprot:GSA120T00017401001.1